MLILKFRKYNNSLYKLSSDFQMVTVLGLQFIIFILQQLHNLITTALLMLKYRSSQSNLTSQPLVRIVNDQSKVVEDQRPESAERLVELSTGDPVATLYHHSLGFPGPCLPHY